MFDAILRCSLAKALVADGDLIRDWSNITLQPILQFGYLDVFFFKIRSTIMGQNERPYWELKSTCDALFIE